MVFHLSNSHGYAWKKKSTCQLAVYITTGDKNFILDVGTEKNEGISITHSCIPLYTVYSTCKSHSGGMQEW